MFFSPLYNFINTIRDDVLWIFTRLGVVFTLKFKTLSVLKINIPTFQYIFSFIISKGSLINHILISEICLNKEVFIPIDLFYSERCFGMDSMETHMEMPGKDSFWFIQGLVKNMFYYT